MQKLCGSHWLIRHFNAFYFMCFTVCMYCMLYSAHLLLWELLFEWTRPERPLPGRPRAPPLGLALTSRLGALAGWSALPARGSVHKQFLRKQILSSRTKYGSFSFNCRHNIRCIDPHRNAFGAIRECEGCCRIWRARRPCRSRRLWNGQLHSTMKNNSINSVYRCVYFCAWKQVGKPSSDTREWADGLWHVQHPGCTIISDSLFLFYAFLC